MRYVRGQNTKSALQKNKSTEIYNGRKVFKVPPKIFKGPLKDRPATENHFYEGKYNFFLYKDPKTFY